MLLVVSVMVIPLMFPQLKWFYAVVAYIMGQYLPFCNAYKTGLIDMNMAYNYEKVALFMVTTISRRENDVMGRWGFPKPTYRDVGVFTLTSILRSPDTTSKFG